MMDPGDISINQALRILQVRDNATPDEITAAWRNLMRAVHPDRNPNSPDVARRQFDAVQAAYKKLSEPEVMALRKAAYARGPSAPFNPGEIEAFRVLGLGPSASYQDIDDRLEELIEAGDTKGDYKRAADVLRGAHRQALAKLQGMSPEDSYSRPLQPGEFRQRGPVKPAKAANNLKAGLYVGAGVLLGIVCALLFGRHDALLAILAAIAAVGCLAGGALAAGII